MKKLFETIQKHLKNKHLPYLFLAFFIIAVYGQVLSFDFTLFDDDWLVMEQETYYGNISNIFEVLSQNIIPAEYHYFRPVLIISFFVDFFIAGSTAPFFYHLTNTLLHIAVTLLLFYMLRRFFTTDKAALSWSIIFACHPVFAQAVAWVPGRNDSLLTLFTLLSFIFFLKVLKKRNILYVFLAIIFFAAAVFTKENAVFLPALFALYLFLKYPLKAASKKDIIQMAVFFIVFAAVICAYAVLRTESIGKFLPDNPYIMLITGIPKILIVYAGKIFLPFNLSVIPFIPDTNLILGFSAITACVLLITFFAKIKDKKLFIFGFAWFAAFLVPSLLSLQVIMLEHRVYLPAIGLIISFSQLYFPAVQKIPVLAKRILFIVFIVYFSGLTFAHSLSFRSPLIFWENAVKKAPSYYAVYSNLAKVYLEIEHNLAKAGENLEKAHELNPVQTKDKLAVIEKIKEAGGIEEYILQQQTRK